MPNGDSTLTQHANKIMLSLITAALVAAAAAMVKLERLEAKFEALRLDELPALVQENHTQLEVQTVKLQSIDEKLAELKRLLSEESP